MTEWFQTIILKRMDGSEIYRSETASMVKEVVEEAVRKGISLAYANLEKAHLCEVNLNGANLEKANLSGAYMREVNLTRAILDYATLEEANLEEANLTGANMYAASLENANLEGANLENASLCKSNLIGANLNGANLKGADLWRVAGADLWKNDLEEKQKSGPEFSWETVQSQIEALLPGCKMEEKDGEVWIRTGVKVKKVYIVGK